MNNEARRQEEKDALGKDPQAVRERQGAREMRELGVDRRADRIADGVEFQGVLVKAIHEKLGRKIRDTLPLRHQTAPEVVILGELLPVSTGSQDHLSSKHHGRMGDAVVATEGGGNLARVQWQPAVTDEPPLGVDDR